MARILTEAVRDGDRTARLGGDEFIVALAGTNDFQTAANVAARRSEAVSALASLGPDRDERIGISIGVGHVDGAASYSNALCEADADLYRRKVERPRRAVRRVESVSGVARSGSLELL